MNEQEWHERRNAGITGTAAAAIMGDSPYMNSVDLWMEKTGRKAPVQFENELTIYGKTAEQYLIELFRLDYPEYEVKHKDFDLRINRDYPWLIGSIDGELLEKETGRKGILEIKTAEIRNGIQADQWKGGIPQHYFWQVLHYLLVTGFDFVVVKAQLKYKFDDLRLVTKHYRFNRDEVDDLLDTLFEEEKKFWAYVENDLRPPLQLPKI